MNIADNILDILEISYGNFFYIFFALFIGILIDQYYGNFDKSSYEKKNLIIYFFDISLHIIILSLFVYIIKKIVNKILLLPFNIIRDNKDVQIQDASIYIAMLFIFQINLINKIKYFLYRLDDKFPYIKNYK